MSKRWATREQKETIANRCGTKRKLVLLLQAVHVYWITVWFYIYSYKSGGKKVIPELNGNRIQPKLVGEKRMCWSDYSCIRLNLCNIQSFQFLRCPLSFPSCIRHTAVSFGGYNKRHDIHTWECRFFIYFISSYGQLTRGGTLSVRSGR
jgi:hypothetical protein